MWISQKAMFSPYPHYHKNHFPKHEVKQKCQVEDQTKISRFLVPWRGFHKQTETWKVHRTKTVSRLLLRVNHIDPATWNRLARLLISTCTTQSLSASEKQTPNNCTPRPVSEGQEDRGPRKAGVRALQSTLSSSCLSPTPPPSTLKSQCSVKIPCITTTQIPCDHPSALLHLKSKNKTPELKISGRFLFLFSAA